MGQGMLYRVGDTVMLDRTADSGEQVVDAYEVLRAAPRMLSLKHLWTERKTGNATERQPGITTIEVTDPQQIGALRLPRTNQTASPDQG